MLSLPKQLGPQRPRRLLSEKGSEPVFADVLVLAEHVCYVAIE